jgi:hypothetical protein
MSATAQDVLNNVRVELKDEDDGRPVVSDDLIRRKIDDRVVYVADTLALHPEWVSSAIALVAGTDAYELSTANEYGEVKELRYASTTLGLPGLVKVTRERMSELREVTTIPTQRPTYYSLEPQPDQHMRVVFDSKPATGENVDALVSIVPVAWGTGDDAAPTMPFSRRALRALELLVTADVGVTLNAEQLTQLKMNPASFARCERDAMKLLAKEWIAVSALRLSHGRTYRTWSLAWRNS